MRTAIFNVIVNYASNTYMIKAQDRIDERFNYVANNLTAVVTKQFQITRDLSKQGVKALFEYK